jgi:hypothetical protein
MCTLPIVGAVVALIWFCAYAASRFDRYDAPSAPSAPPEPADDWPIALDRTRHHPEERP